MISNKHFDNFLIALDEKRFYDAHEVLEELWFPKRFENSNEVRLLKGFINASVYFELIKKGRPLAAKKVWINYLKYRQLIFKTSSAKVNIYYKIQRHIELLYNNQKIT